MTSHVPAGVRVGRWLQARGLTLQQAADLTGLQKNKLWRITSGKQEPKLVELEAICAAIDITVADFLGELPEVDEPSADVDDDTDTRNAIAG